MSKSGGLKGYEISLVEEFQKYPVRFVNHLWPDIILYKEQRMIMESVRDTVETYVPAANMMGKDFISGLIALWGFLVHPVARVITTSVKDDHLDVVWGEIGRFIQTCRVPLSARKGGHLILNHHDVTKVYRDKNAPDGWRKDTISYLKGMVSAKGEGLAGHHAPYTLLIGDEASGLDDQVHVQGQGWARRFLYIGNCNDCANFFYHAIKEGDILADNPERGVALV